MVSAGASEHKAASDDERSIEINRLIDELSSDEFSDREAATRELIRIGAPALVALDEAATHPDREVRFRVQRAATTIRKNSLQRRISRFTRGERLEGEEALPGWDQFSKVVGDDSKARRLFIEVQKAEYPLMELAGASTDEISEGVGRRAAQLYSAFRDPNERVDPASVAGLLLLAGQEDVEVDDQTFMSIYYVCNNAGFYDAIKQGRDQEMLRRLMAPWIVKTQPTMVYQALVLSMRFGITEGLRLAASTLGDSATLGTLEKRYAIQALAKFGSPEHVKLLEPFLEDDTRISSRLLGDQSLVTQVGDLALAASIHLAGQKVKDFGFKNVTYHNDFVFMETSLGFVDDESRSESLTKWKEYWSAQDIDE